MARHADGRPTWDDVVWRADDGLLARIHRPGPGSNEVEAATGGPDRSGLVIDIHGGAWAGLDRTVGQAYDEALAQAGLTVVAVDFRDGRQARHPAAVDDIVDAVAWARERAGIDHDGRLALIGSSSGGHLALQVAIDHLSGIEVALVAALWPPVDPLGRYRYARSMVGRPVPEGNRLDAERLVASTEAYFGDEDTMGRASIAELVRSDPDLDLPPVWLVEAGDDLNVPPAMLDELVATCRAAGGTIERTTYPGETHGFGHRSTPGARRFRRDLVERLLAAVGPM